MTNEPDPPESGDQSKPPAAKPKAANAVLRFIGANGGPLTDKYEYRLEIFGSVILIMVGVLLWTAIGGKLGQAVGANLLAAGCVALIVFFVYGQLRSARTRLQTKQEEDHVQEAIDAGLAKSLSVFHAAKKIGLTGSNIGRPTDLNDVVLEATERLDILEISLKTMQSINDSRWRECEAKIRIILLDPRYPSEEVSLARQRDIEEGMGEGQILSEIHEILELFPEEWFTSNENKSALRLPDPDRSGGGASAQPKADEARVKLARAMPTMSYFRFDGLAYFAPLVHKRLGDKTMHLKLSQDGELFAALEAHFDELWNDKKRVVTVRPADIPPHYRSLGSSPEGAS